MGDSVPVTKKGKGKTQNGKKFGKKHTEAMFEFTKNLWLQDATTSLRNLLQIEAAQQAFLAFLKTEYGEAQLEFFLEVQRLERLSPQEQQQQAQRIYQMFMSAGGKGIGQQERTAATQKLWDQANQSGTGGGEAQALDRVRYEAEATLNMLAFDAFPRFIKSPFCEQAMMAIRQAGGNPQIEAMINQTGSKAPVDADDWLNIFVQSAESFPACIVISDMTIPGAPMVFVNQEFVRTTGYAREEATGRNCRFLQGPDTEPEAIQVIRNTLSKGQDCHVKLTNYRKNGDKFQNLLSMKPVFDADGIYRFVIGVQFEVKEDQNLKQRLVQLDKLLRLLPSKLNLRSKATARAKGALAVKVTGEQNQLLGNKEGVLQQTKQMEQQENQSGEASRRPKALASTPLDTPMSQMNCDNTMYAFTKIMWLNKAPEATNAIIGDPLGRQMFMQYCQFTSSLYLTHVEFLIKFAEIATAQGPQQAMLMKKAHIKKNKNSVFYCTTTEINYGTINQQNWGPVFQEMTQKMQMMTVILATEVLPKFMNSRLGYNLVMAVRQREMSGQALALRTVAAGLDKNAETYWLDMFRVMSETSTIGMVVSDMTVPGIPLLHINEGFKTVTGYGKEKISTSCRFLQGPDTQKFLNEEICEALRHGEPLIVKINNYKANKQLFQCLLGLQPVFGPQGEYKFQIGVQIDFNMNPDVTRQLLEMERILRYLPKSITGQDPEDIAKIMPTDFMGDQTLYPFVKIDPSEVKQSSVSYAANPKAAEVMATGKEVSTKKGKNKDQYGRAFGKKQKGALLEFTKSLWLQDAISSLRNLLQFDYAQQAIMAFLKTEYGEAQLEFYLEAQRLEQTQDPNQKAQMAVQLYGMYVGQAGKGIGQQERTAKTQQLWDQANQTGAGQTDPNTAMMKIREEAENTLKMLAFDAFPRFMKSPFCEQLVAAMRQSGNSSAAQLEGMLSQAGSKAPQDADDWLNTFVSTAESFPACIVISDMTIPGAPMVFVNEEFSRTTGYPKEEATGRNCRFLQGPDTEPEAIQVIRNTLSKGQDCHVKLTNYRKNGDKFQNLLSMKPVFDADGIYRFVIGVQFEVKEDQNLKQRLVQLDKLLRLLPSKLNLRSKASARAKGALAVKVTGEANQFINSKEQIMQQAKQMEQQEAATGKSRPKEIVQVSAYDPRSVSYDATVAAFTKIMWLQDPVAACRGILSDPTCRQMFTAFAEVHCSELVRTHLRFIEWAMAIRTAPANDQMRKIRLGHMKYDKNPLFYCTSTVIVVHTLNQLNWGPVFETMCVWQEQTTFMLAQEAFPRFLEHPSGSEMILLLRRREASGETVPVRTVAAGINQTSETFWLDMFRAMSETVTIGMVISDMTVPGIPLVHINEGFKVVTGYGKEKIGTSCRFLQGKETEQYLNDEIMAALQQSERLVTKLHNYKANGQKFQCLLALQPVFGPAPDHEYKYQIGLQIDFNNSDPDLPRKLIEFGRVLRHLPQCVSGEKVAGVDQAIAEMGGGQQSGGGGMGMGMGGGGGFGAPMGGMGMGGGGGFGQPAPPMGGPPSFGSPRKNSFQNGGMGGGMGGFGAPAGGGGMGGFGAPAGGGGMGGFGF
eukprot:gene7869-16101_t